MTQTSTSNAKQVLCNCERMEFASLIIIRHSKLRPSIDHLAIVCLLLARPSLTNNKQKMAKWSIDGLNLLCLIRKSSIKINFQKSTRFTSVMCCGIWSTYDLWLLCIRWCKEMEWGFVIFSYKTEDSRSFYLFINLLYNAWYKSFKNITFLFRYKRLFYGTHMSFFNMIAVSHF